eukprot:Lankesteria_metandrocarpae@DN249_c0_g1_i1.p1
MIRSDRGTITRKRVALGSRGARVVLAAPLRKSVSQTVQSPVDRSGHIDSHFSKVADGKYPRISAHRAVVVLRGSEHHSVAEMPQDTSTSRLQKPTKKFITDITNVPASSRRYQSSSRPTSSSHHKSADHHINSELHSTSVIRSVIVPTKAPLPATVTPARTAATTTTTNTVTPATITNTARTAASTATTTAAAAATTTPATTTTASTTTTSSTTTTTAATTATTATAARTTAAPNVLVDYATTQRGIDSGAIVESANNSNNVSCSAKCGVLRVS